VIESHSIAGYSGSPVFVRPFSTPKLLPSYGESFPGNTNVYVSAPPSFSGPMVVPQALKGGGPMPAGPWLLGIERSFIHQKDKQGIKMNTGMSAVVPAWHILDLLNTEKMRRQRQAEQERLLARI